MSDLKKEQQEKIDKIKRVIDCKEIFLAAVLEDENNLLNITYIIDCDAVVIQSLLKFIQDNFPEDFETFLDNDDSIENEYKEDEVTTNRKHKLDS